METHFENIEQSRRELAKGRLLNQLKALATDAEELLRVTAGEVGETAHEARLQLAAALERAKASCAAFEQKALAGARATDKAIRANPYPLVRLAFGVGLIVGLLANRR